MNPKKVLALIALLLVVATFNAPHSASADVFRHLKIVSLQAFKYQGYQPLDVSVQITDEFGNPVSDADVVIANDQDPTALGQLQLKSMGKGTYTGCDIAYLDSQFGVALTAVASKTNWTGTTASVKSQPGNLCGDGAPQMIVTQISAAKPDGKGQALDIAIKLNDELGRAVVGANVMAEATDGTGAVVDVLLADRGNGLYTMCAAALFDTSGAGAIKIHARAYAPGFRAAEGYGSNTVGRICSTSTAPPPNS